MSILALEVPSGVLADLVGRRTLLRVGAASSLLEFALFLLAHRVWPFALAVLVGGIGHVCVSGAWNALLYDSLAAMGRTDRFVRTLGRIAALGVAAAALAGLAGGLLAERYGFSLHYAISMGSFCGMLSKGAK